MFGLDFALAVALLGISLGHDLTYSCYYQIKNLGIFNQYEESNMNFEINHPETGKVLTVSEAQSLLYNCFDELKSLKEEFAAKDETISQLTDELDKLKSDNTNNCPSEDLHISEQQESLSSHDNTVAQSDQPTQVVFEQEEPIEAVSSVDIVKESIHFIHDEPNESEQDYSVPQNENTDDSEIEEKDSTSIEFTPILMRKLTQKRDKFCTGRWAKEKYAHDRKEYDDLLQDNYDPENYFENNSLFDNLEK